MKKPTKFFVFLFTAATILALSASPCLYASPSTVSGNNGDPSVSDNNIPQPDNPQPDNPQPDNPQPNIPQTTITLSVTNGSDITQALNAALSRVKTLASSGMPYTIKVPAGSYTISSTLQIYSNTILDLTGVSITSDPNAPEFTMLMTGNYGYTLSAACKGYDGFENITILGGTFTAAPTHYPAPIRLMHAKNITLQGLTVGGGVGDHLIETAALQNFLVDGCTLQNMSVASSTDNKTREALQLDLAVHDSIYPGCHQDGTMMQNVTIQNCTFRNVSRGIGGHSLLLNAYHENIKILNNTFTDVREECIIAGNYYNCEISGNIIKNCGSGIVFQYAKSNKKTVFTTLHNGTVPYKGTIRHDAKTVIKNNTIHLIYTGNMDAIAGIKLYGRNITAAESNSVDGGTIPAADYYLSGVEIAGNAITTAGYGILLQDARNCVIRDNQIKGTGYNNSDKNVKEDRYHGIYIGTGSTGTKISTNTISSVLSNAIQVQADSGASEITKNTINTPGDDGISVFAASRITGDIASNTITKPGEHGISFNDSVISGSIRDNLISNAALCGINIFEDSEVKGNIAGNTISGSQTNGINIGGASKVKGNIASNMVSASAQNGIQIISKSKVQGSVTSNTVSDSKTGNGISAVNEAIINGSLTGNTVSNSKKVGINVYNKSEVGGNIENNTVDKSTEVGIRIGASSKLSGNITNNTVSASKKSGIQASDKSTVYGKIASNTVTNSTANGIYITTSSKAKKGITNNTIKKAKKYGIYVLSKSTVNKDIIGNKISSCDTPIVVTPDCTVSIRKNTMKKNKNNYSRIATTSIKVKTLKAAKFSSVSGKGKKITLKWKKVSGANGYYIELSTRPDFKKISKKIDTTSRSAVFKKLKKGKTYYVRISTYKKSGKARIYSNYSKVKKIKVS